MQDSAAHARARRAAALIAVVFGLALYYWGGALEAYLAADDFQWLHGGRQFRWSDLTPAGRDHFYRPLVSLWFAGAARVCGASPGCYHALSLAVHAVNIALVFALGLILTRDRATAFVAAVLFAAQPAYVQAVVWVSASTGLLATAWCLTALWCQSRSWSAGDRARLWEIAAVLAFACAVSCHEAAAVLPLMALIWHRAAAPRTIRFRLLAAGFGLVFVLFAIVTVVANRQNYVFTEGHYGVGLHAVPNALDYIVSLWVGPHVVWGYAATVLGLLALLRIDRSSRAATVLMLIALVPYVGFTWGNVGRYAYLPSVGFSWAVASALTVGWRRAAADPGRGARTASLVVGVIVLAVAARFAAFTVKGVGVEAGQLEASRTYVRQVISRYPTPPDGVLHAPAPTMEFVDPRYVEVMLRWVYGRPDLRVVVQ